VCEYLNLGDQLFNTYTDEFKRSHKDQIQETLMNVYNLVEYEVDRINGPRLEKQNFSRNKTIEISLFHYKAYKEAVPRIERIRDEELMSEMNVLELFVIDLKLLKYGLDDRDYHQAIN
jgi:hypothetical protein